MTSPQNQLFGDGVKRIKGGESRRHNLLAAKLIANLVKNSLGPYGTDKMFIDILGEVTVTKDGATFLRKIDVEHPAAKVMIEASNAVDNEVGDGTKSVVVFAGALVENAEELLEMGISPTTICDGYQKGLEVALEVLTSISLKAKNSDRHVLISLVKTCLQSKALSSYIGLELIAKLVVDATSSVADFENNKIEVDNIKIEEKSGNVSDTQLVMGVVIDKTIDNSLMPRMVRNAKILLINEDLEPKRTKTEAEIQISTLEQIKSFHDIESLNLKQKVQRIIDSGTNVVISQSGINLQAQSYLAQKDIISIRRVKENDLLWLEKATGAKITKDLDRISEKDLGYAEKVYEKYVGDDRMVFVDGCINPKSVTILLRAGSKRLLDEFHRSILDAISVIDDFITQCTVVAGGGAAEVAIAKRIRENSIMLKGKKQVVMQKFAGALEEIPLTIARNSGMDIINTLSELHINRSNSGNRKKCYGINALDKTVEDMISLNIIEPAVVKAQVISTAVEVTNLLIRVDDVLMAKPIIDTHTHADGTTHSHDGGRKDHDHFDRLGKKQRSMHHYY